MIKKSRKRQQVRVANANVSRMNYFNHACTVCSKAGCTGSERAKHAQIQLEWVILCIIVDCNNIYRQQLVTMPLFLNFSYVVPASGDYLIQHRVRNDVFKRYHASISLKIAPAAGWKFRENPRNIHETVYLRNSNLVSTSRPPLQNTNPDTCTLTVRRCMPLLSVVS